jgi:transposase-like protein
VAAGHPVLCLPARGSARDRHDQRARAHNHQNRGHVPTDEAATKLIWLALRNITARWGGKAGNSWHVAMQPFAILFEDRFTNPAS